MVVEKNQNSGQKPRWRHVDYFFNKNSTETPSSGFVRHNFLTQICLFLKKGHLRFERLTTKFKMASETNIFLILLSKLQFSTDFQNLECIRSVFLSSLFQKSK
jgi:hypothetical protein